jgi:hypothetical protein
MKANIRHFQVYFLTENCSNFITVKYFLFSHPLFPSILSFLPPYTHTHAHTPTSPPPTHTHTHTHTAILTDGGAFPRYHALLEEQNIPYADLSSEKAKELLQNTHFYSLQGNTFLLSSFINLLYFLSYLHYLILFYFIFLFR